MRILRGQSNLEVSSKGFALFVVGLVLATFAGGAVRTVLSSEQVHRRIVSELKNRFPKHEFQIGETEVLLSRGGWPGFALRLRNVTFKQDVCGKLSFLLTLPQTTLPLDLWSAAHGRWRLNDVRLEGGELHLDYRDCANKPTAGSSTAAGGAKSAAPPALHKSVLAPKFNWQEMAEVLNGINLKNFAVTYEKAPTWKLVLNSSYLSLGKKLSLKAQIDVEKSLPFGALTHPVTLEMRGEEQVLAWDVNAEFKEGRIQVSGSTDMKDSQGQLKVLLRQVPLKDFMSEIYQMGFVERELKLKATWLSCALEWQGSVESYGEKPLHVHDCRAEGGYGRAELNAADFWLEGDYLRAPAHIEIVQLQMQPVMEALNREVLPAVVSHLGVWGGTLDLKSGSEWTLDGFLENAEVVFSNQSTHGKQVIEKLHTQVQKVEHRIQATVDELLLRDGEFAGKVSFDLSEDWRDGRFQAKIKKFNVSPAIQKLLVGGVLGDLRGEGQGTLLGGELNQWAGGFSLPEIRGEGWRSGALQIQSRYANGVFHLEGKVLTATADSAWHFYSQLRAVDAELPEQVSWRDLVMKMDISKSGGTLQSFTASETVKGRAWKAKGAWARDADFNGSLAVSKGNRAQTFSLHGEKGALSVDGEQASSN